MLGIDMIVLFITVIRILEMHRNLPRTGGRGYLALRFAVPIICFVAVLIIAVSVLMGQTSGLYWFVPVVIVLFWVASINAWELLLQLGRPPKGS
jgi:multisubunit Na+/H+ antiporter MnhB subunit